MSRILPTTALAMLGLTLVLSAQQTTQAPPTSPQQPGLTFRSMANYVEVDAIVTDKAGAIVRNLTGEDFEVIEDGKPQALSVCGFVDIPFVRPDPLLFRDRIIEPDVVSNEKPFDGRVFLIVLDSYHVAPRRTTEVKRRAAEFIEKYLGDNDLAAVAVVGHGPAGQEFTSNKRLLTAAVNRFAGEGLPSETENKLRDALQKQNEQIPMEQIDPKTGAVTLVTPDPGPPMDNDALVREYKARESLETVRRLALDMTELTGRRKALLFFSEGIAIDLLKPDDAASLEGGGNAGAISAAGSITTIVLSQRAMISAATRSNVSIYPIDPRGLLAGGGDAALPVQPGAPVQGAAVPVSRNYNNPALVSDVMTEQRRSQDQLRTLSETTGGLAIVDQNDMDAAFRRIVDDNSSYYILGYRSADPRRDGRYHRIEIKAKRPGLQVRSRTGYYAPSDKTAAKRAAIADPVVKMLAMPTPIGGLGMRASASVMKGRLLKSTVHLTIEFNGKDVAVRPVGPVLTNDITIEYVALDMNGAIQANAREDVHLQLERRFHATFGERGVRYMNEFELAPGRYQLRVAARDALGGRTGSVFIDLDVPDIAAMPFAMGDVLLTSSSASETATGKSTPAFGALLPTPPVTTRTFAPTETLTMLAAFYDQYLDVKHNVDLKVIVTSDAGAEVFQHEEVRDGADFNPANGGYRWTTSIPLQGLAPGRYMLTVAGRSRLGDAAAVTREVEFRVR